MNHRDKNESVGTFLNIKLLNLLIVRIEKLCRRKKPSCSGSNSYLNSSPILALWSLPPTHSQIPQFVANREGEKTHTSAVWPRLSGLERVGEVTGLTAFTRGAENDAA